MPTKSKVVQAKHARAHYEKKMDFVRSFRNERGCEECGEKHPAVLDLHHRDPSTKVASLKKKAGGKKWAGLSWANLREELEKCIVLCSNCHRIEESQRRQAELAALQA